MFIGNKGNCHRALPRAEAYGSLRTQGPITTDVYCWKPSCSSAQAEGPRRRDERNRAHAGVPAFAGTTANIHFVVPANAGTHNHRCLLVESRRAAALKLKGRGVWIPAFAGTTANIHFVVPANAGTHNHRCLLLAKATAAVPLPRAAAYGSLRSQGRRLIYFVFPAFAGTRRLSDNSSLRKLEA